MSSVLDLSTQSGFVFEAEVEQLEASAAPGFPSSPETAVLLVKKVLKGPSTLAQFNGQRITIALQAPVSVTTGQTAVFFTHGLHYGEGIVVQEVGNMPSDETMQAQVDSATQSAQDDELTQRLAQADMVITGTASAPRSYAGVPSRVGKISEHDPDWGVATISVESTEKGAPPGPTKDVIFARSNDIAWFRAPKIKEGDHGSWLLHKQDPFGKPVPADAIVHPLDFQPAAQTQRVLTLLNNTPK